MTYKYHQVPSCSEGSKIFESERERERTEKKRDRTREPCPFMHFSTFQIPNNLGPVHIILLPSNCGSTEETTFTFNLVGAGDVSASLSLEHDPSLRRMVGILTFAPTVAGRFTEDGSEGFDGGANKMGAIQIFSLGWEVVQVHQRKSIHVCTLMVFISPCG